MAARILFYIVHWLRSIKEFQMINVKDQVRRHCSSHRKTILRVISDR